MRWKWSTISHRKMLSQGSMHLPIRPKTTEMPGTNIAAIRAPPDSSSVIKTCSMTDAEFCPAIWSSRSGSIGESLATDWIGEPASISKDAGVRCELVSSSTLGPRSKRSKLVAFEQRPRFLFFRRSNISLRVTLAGRMLKGKATTTATNTENVADHFNRADIVSTFSNICSLIFVQMFLLPVVMSASWVTWMQ